MSKKKSLVLISVCVFILVATIVGWILSSDAVHNMNDGQTLVYAKFFGIKDSFDFYDDAFCSRVRMVIDDSNALDMTGYDYGDFVKQVTRSLTFLHLTFAVILLISLAGEVVCIALLCKSVRRRSSAL